MRRIDELFMKYPFYGSRQMARQLRRDGVCVGRHRVRRLMRLIGLEAIYQAPRTSVPHPMHRIYPYLLKGMAIDQPQSGLVRRHHLYPRPAWLSDSRCWLEMEASMDGGLSFRGFAHQGD